MLKANLPKRGRWVRLGEVASAPEPPSHLMAALDAAIEDAWVAKEDFDAALAIFKVPFHHCGAVLAVCCCAWAPPQCFARWMWCCRLLYAQYVVLCVFLCYCGRVVFELYCA